MPSVWIEPVSCTAGATKAAFATIATLIACVFNLDLRVIDA